MTVDQLNPAEDPADGDCADPYSSVTGFGGVPQADQQTVDLSQFDNEPVELRFYFDTGDNLYNDYGGWYVNNIQVTGTRSGAPVTVFSDPVSAGDTAFTADSDYGTAPGWQVAPDSPLGGAAWWYGDPGTGSYQSPDPTDNCTDSDLNFGSITSPVINLASDSQLTFDTLWQIESVNPSSYDLMDVQVIPVCSDSVAFGAYLATTQDGSCFTQNGNVYTTSSPIYLNGVGIVPNSGQISIDTTSGSESLQADDAQVQIGGFTVYSGSIATSLVGSFSLQVSADATIGELKIGGSLSLAADSSTGFTITGDVSLPKGLGGGTVQLSASTSASQGFYAASVKASDFSIPVKGVKIGLKDFSLSYDVPSDTWTGSITIGLPTPSGTTVSGSITITDGAVTQFSASADNINAPLGPEGVFLQELGADIVLDPPPASITGTAGISAGPKIKGVQAVSVDGSLSYIFSSPADFRMTGNLVILKGTAFSQALAGGQLDYYSDGHITLSGHASINLTAATVSGTLDGWISGTSAFSLSGGVTVTVGLLKISGTGVVSNAGIAACGHLFGSSGPSAGIGYLWGGSVTVMGSSCGLGAYSSAPNVVIPGVPGASFKVKLPAKLPEASFQVTGRNGTAPAGTLTDPAGHKLTINPAKQGVFTGSDPEYALGVDSVNGIDYIVVNAPAGGTWTFTPAAGSSVSSVSSAQGLPAPAVRAKVTGKGLHRTLSWNLASLSGQHVTFVEEAPGVDKVLASNVSQTHGKVTFTPADGPAGKRSIMAVISQNGLTSQTIKVASYTAPATASVTVTLTDASGGTGTVAIAPAGVTCTSTCTLAVLTGKTVTLTPAPGSGATFTWTGGPCAGNGACNLTIPQETAVTGQFSG